MTSETSRLVNVMHTYAFLLRIKILPTFGLLRVNISAKRGQKRTVENEYL